MDWDQKKDEQTYILTYTLKNAHKKTSGRTTHKQVQTGRQNTFVMILNVYLLPVPENLKEINTQKFSNTVNCSGVLEPPYNAFKLLHRDTSGSWVEKSNILSKRTSLDRISNCWLKGYEIFTLKNSQDKTWKCATHFQKS